jgi:hypothetical protein
MEQMISQSLFCSMQDSTYPDQNNPEKRKHLILEEFVESGGREGTSMKPCLWTKKFPMVSSSS